MVSMQREKKQQVFTPKEVAEALSCHYMTVIRMIHDGTLPADKLTQNNHSTGYRISRRTLEKCYPSIFGSD